MTPTEFNLYQYIIYIKKIHKQIADIFQCPTTVNLGLKIVDKNHSDNHIFIYSKNSN